MLNPTDGYNWSIKHGIKICTFIINYKALSLFLKLLKLILFTSSQPFSKGEGQEYITIKFTGLKR